MSQRYIRLDGTPPQVKAPVLRHIFTAESAAGLITTAAVAAAAGGVTDMRSAFVAAACGAAGSVAGQIFFKNLFGRALNFLFGDLDKVTFDTKPDRRTPPTKPSHRLAAENLHEKNMRGAASIGALTLPHTVMLGTMAAVMPEIAIIVITAGAMVTTFGLNMATNMMISGNRFGKVVSGDWQILDGPPPREVKVQKRKDVFSVTPMPQPF
jgi:hypothetical protein